MRYSFTLAILCSAIALASFPAALSIGAEAKAPAADKPKSDTLPASLAKEAADMRKECVDFGAKPKNGPADFIESVDLTGDGLPDYIFDPTKFDCEGAASLFGGGSGGNPLKVLVSTAPGIVKPAWDNLVGGYDLDRSGGIPVLYLILGGGYCGQKNFKSNADAIFCQRPLEWNAAKKTLELAPLSKIRPLKQ